MEEITKYADNFVSTTNPAILPDGSNTYNAPAPETDSHIHNKVLWSLRFDKDLADLVATCQRHTQCFAAYYLLLYKQRPTGSLNLVDPLHRVKCFNPYTSLTILGHPQYHSLLSYTSSSVDATKISKTGKAGQPQ